MTPGPTPGALNADAALAMSRTMSPTPSARTGQSDPSTRASAKVGTSSRFEFLLFSYLLRFVHREGRIGDFARAGLLFLFDIAFLTPTDEGAENLHLGPSKDGSDPLQDARDALGEFILDGDFAEVMAAGLGAVYSLLPSKLHVPTLAEQATLANPEDGQRTTDVTSGGLFLGGPLATNDAQNDLASSADSELNAQLDLILKLFGFIQDILRRCSSPLHHTDPDHTEISTTQLLGEAISDATLDAIRSSFLDNVLYPSILECSSSDGSAVAVLTYLNVTFSNLDDGPLLTRITEFLLDTAPMDELHTSTHHQPRRRTGAMGYVRRGEPQTTTDYYADEGRFMLKDLILDNVRSSSAESATAALRLLGTLLSDHCHESMRGILSPIHDTAGTAGFAGMTLAKQLASTRSGADDVAKDDWDPPTILPAAINSLDPSLQEVELYGSLIGRIDSSQTSADLTAGYAGYLADMQAAIQRDACFVEGHTRLHRMHSGENLASQHGITESRTGTTKHRLSPADGVIRIVLSSLSNFLCQSPDENVALTGVLTALALCPNRSLSGWLLYDTNRDVDPWSSRSGRQRQPPATDYATGSVSDDDSDEDLDIDLSRHDEVDNPFAARTSTDLPAVYQILRELVRQISSFRAGIEGFDHLLAERRRGLLFADHLDEAMNVQLEVDSSSVFGTPAGTGSGSNTASPVPNRRRVSGFATLRSYLTPKKKTQTQSSTLGSASTQNTPNLIRGTADPATPPRSGTPLTTTPSDAMGTPPRSHSDHVGAMSVEAAPSPPPATGPWARPPAHAQTQPDSIAGHTHGHGHAHGHTRAPSALSQNQGAHGSDQPQSREGDDDIDDDADDERKPMGPRMVGLSQVLDNCVVLEEFLKELVAVVTARRALGVDQVGFV
jgi:hypothetical protein